MNDYFKIICVSHDLRTVLCFSCVSMSSDDEEAQSPVLGAGSSKDPPPPLESESEQSDDELPKKKSKSYKRPRINWESVLFFVKGDEATVDEGEMKIQIFSAANKIMDDARMFRMPGHVPGPTDVGLWKLKTEWTIDGGKTVVKWLQCPMTHRFQCK